VVIEAPGRIDLAVAQVARRREFADLGACRRVDDRDVEPPKLLFEVDASRPPRLRQQPLSTKIALYNKVGGHPKSIELLEGWLASGRVTEARDVAEAACAALCEHRGLLLQNVAAHTRYLQECVHSLDKAETARLLAATRELIDVLKAGRLKDDPAAALDDDATRDLYPLRYSAELALLEGRVGDAAELFEKALTVDASYSGAWLGLAECARFAGDRKRALKLYLRAVTENEWNVRAWLRGCSLLDELEFRDNADTWRRKVAVQFPELPAVLASRYGMGAACEPAGFTVSR